MDSRLSENSIVKFILRLLIAGLILGLIIWGIIGLFSSNTENLTIVNYANDNIFVSYDTSADQQENDIDYNLNELYQKIISQENIMSTDFSGELLNNSIMLNRVMKNYIKTFVNLTQFQNKSNEDLKQEVLNSLKIYVIAQNDTFAYLKNVLNYTNNSQFEISEFNRLMQTFYAKYKAQLNLMYISCEKVENYVTQVNYEGNLPKTVNNTLLQVQLDFTKVVLDNELENTEVTNMPLSNQLEAIYNKYVAFKISISGSTENLNALKINFINSYDEFNDKTQYFLSTDKNEYVGSMANFTDEIQFDYAQAINNYLNSATY